VLCMFSLLSWGALRKDKGTYWPKFDRPAALIHVLTYSTPTVSSCSLFYSGKQEISVGNPRLIRARTRTMGLVIGVVHQVNFKWCLKEARSHMTEG